MKGKKLSRRDFLQGAALSAAGVATGSLAPSITLKDEEILGSFLPEKWDDEADIIIVGYGGSGSMAAVSALENGSSVIVLEKAGARLGGNLGQSRGTLHDCPYADVEEWADCYERVTFKTGAPRDQIIEFMKEAVIIGDWMEGYGIDINWRETPHETGYTWPKWFMEGQCTSGRGNGFDLFLEIDKVASNMDVDVRLSTPAKRLIQNPTTKEILGVVAENGGKELYFKAKKAVIMACGGYDRNHDMFHNYNYPGIDLVGGGGGNPCNTGDGFPMVMEVGAKLWHMSNIHYGGTPGPVAPFREEGISEGISEGRLNLDGTSAAPAPSAGNARGYIFVGCHGKRFMNEVYGRAHDSNHKPCFDYSTQVAFSKLITTSEDPSVLKYTERVSDYVHIPMFAIIDQQQFESRNPLMNGTEDNDEALAKGWIFKGETLEELAGKITGKRANGVETVNGIDAKTLQETLNTYNQYCAEGNDPEFLRDPSTLTALSETGPYYAYEVMMGMDFTEGGPQRNGKCQTISVFDEVIPRLYTTGNFGSFNSLAYVIGCIVQALTTGRIAGREASTLTAWD